MPPPSHQATVSLALAAVMVAAVGALAYPLFAEDEVPAAATEAIVAPASPDKEAGPSETVSRFLAEHAPVAEPKAEAPAAAEVPVVAPAEVAVVPTVSAAPVIAAVPAKVEPAMEPPAAPQETAQQKRQREQHEAAVARQAARAAAQEKALAERAARAAAQKAAAEKAAEERAARQAADKLAAEKAAAEKAARLAAEKAAAERAAAEKLARAPAEPVAPVTKKAVAPSAGWEEVSTDKPAAPKRDMTVVVSGDRAWVQVDPKRTISVKAGDVLPGMGRVVEIRDNKVVTEKGTLTNN